MYRPRNHSSNVGISFREIDAGMFGIIKTLRSSWAIWLRCSRISRIPARAYSSAVSSTRGYQLVLVSGDKIRTFDLPSAGEVAIGRDEGTAICIDDPSVSRPLDGSSFLAGFSQNGGKVNARNGFS
jgi:hypothetical protein